jgi:hypothetical protein
MDDIVIRSMQKWPNVPNAFGWLRLDRRGQWLVKSRQSREGAGVFERIGNAAVVEFIGRNYAHDHAGRWFFQNGPQRVFVTLEYTPLVYRLRGDGRGIEAHTGAAPRAAKSAWIDEAGGMVLDTDLGPGVVLDRDLAALADRIVTASGAVAHDVLEDLAAGAALPPLALQLDRASVPLASIAAAEVPARFGFDPDPRPAPGEPEC